MNQETKERLAYLQERRDMWEYDKGLCELKYKGCKYLLQHHKARLWSIESNKCDIAIAKIDKEIKELK